MEVKPILETERLLLREFNLDDAEFILTLLNTPEFLKFIGDKKVHSIEDAKLYLEEGPIKSYDENGFGLWMVELLNTYEPIGMCGLINRPTLEDIDIGFALLSEYAKKGYAFEIASATMDYGTNVIGLKTIIAITDPSNESSQILLKKLGMKLVKEIEEKAYGTSLLFSN